MIYKLTDKVLSDQAKAKPYNKGTNNKSKLTLWTT